MALSAAPSLTHLLDTSVVVRLKNASVRAALAGTRALARAGIIDLEVGAQAGNRLEWDRYMAGLASMTPIATTASHVARALEVQCLLAERSQRGRKIPDLLVAAAAEEHGLTVLHYDADFDLIAAVTGQPTEWVVPAGSVD